MQNDENPFVEDGDPAAELVLKRLDDLKLQLVDHPSFELASMFPKLEGWGAKGEIKRKVTMINAVEPLLDELLMQKERVHYVAKGIQSSILEAMLIGAAWANMLNQTVFVLTNLRIIMIHTDTSSRPRETMWMIYYSQIINMKSSFGSMNLTLVDGKALKFTGFSKLDKESMPQIFEEMLDRYDEYGFDPAVSQSREDICAECFRAVPKGQFVCEACGSTYWKTSELAFRSLIFPAWGDILMKHHKMAFFELIGYIITWCIVFANRHSDPLIFGAIVITLAHFADALATAMIARKGLHLKVRGDRDAPPPKRRRKKRPQRKDADFDQLDAVGEDAFIDDGDIFEKP